MEIARSMYANPTSVKLTGLMLLHMIKVAL